MPEPPSVPPTPEVTPVSSESSKPTTSPSKFPFRLACAAVLVVSFVAYTYITKFKETKITLDQKITSLTTTESTLHQLQTQFSDYKKQSESKTSIIQKPFMFNGKLVVDGNGKPTFVKIYVKDKKSSDIGSSSVFNELSQTVTVTQAVTVVTHRVEDTVSGTKTNGSAYLSIPAEVFLGKIPRVGAGVQHNFFFGSVIGLGAGLNDLSLQDPLKSIYFDMHVGLGIQ
jgi:hypothetical protein